MYIPPGQVGGVTVGDDLDDFAVDGDAVGADGLDDGVEDAEGGVVLEEVGRLLDAAGVVDGDHVERGVLPPVPAPEEVPSDPSESVDRNLQLRFHHCFLVLISTKLFKTHTHTHKTRSHCRLI